MRIKSLKIHASQNQINGISVSTDTDTATALCVKPDVATVSATRTHEARPVSHGRRWQRAGAALMLALSLGGGLAATASAATVPEAQTPVMTVDTSNKATSEQAVANPLSDQTATQVLNSIPNLKRTSGFAWGRFDGAAAVRLLDQNQSVNAGGDVVANKQQLAELAAIRGLSPEGGVDPALVRAFQSLGNNFAIDGHGLDGYQALDRLAHGQPVSANVNGHWYYLTSPAQVQELTALEGNGQDNPLAPATSSLLKKTAEQTPGEGLFEGNNRLDAFTYLQRAEAGATDISYHFLGGPYAEGLQVPVFHFGDLATAAQTAANQHQADSVRPSLAVFKSQMGSLTKTMQDNAGSDVVAAQSRITAGKKAVTDNAALSSEAAQSLPQLEQNVRDAQTWLDGTVPNWQAASDALRSARQNADYYDGQAQTAQQTESYASRALQSARNRLADAEQRLNDAQQTLTSHPATSSSTPAWQQSAGQSSVPAWQQHSQAPSNVPAWQQSSGTSSGTPAWQQNQNSGNDAVRAQALRDQQQASNDVASAHRDIDQATANYRQAQIDRQRADSSAQSADDQAETARQAFVRQDGIHGGASQALSNAQSALRSQQETQRRYDANVQTGNDEIQKGQADLQAAVQLSGLVSGYLHQVQGLNSLTAITAQSQGLTQSVQQMTTLAKNADLQASLKHQATLLSDMAKPAPPAGYHEATPLVMHEQ